MKHQNMKSKNNTISGSPNMTRQCFLKFEGDWDDNAAFLAYYVLSLLTLLAILILIFIKKKYKSLTAKFFVIFFISNCGILTQFIVSALIKNKTVAGDRCLFIKTSYSLHSITTKISVASLVVIMNSNMNKIKSIRSIETLAERKKKEMQLATFWSRSLRRSHVSCRDKMCSCFPEGPLFTRFCLRKPAKVQ